MTSTQSGASRSIQAGRRRALSALAAGASTFALPGLLRAAEFGSRPIRIVVPFPAGGGTDVMGRLLAQALAKELQTTVIVDNVAGATGTVGSAQVARAEPDGNTLLLGISATHAIAPSLFKDLKYQPERDFVPIVRIAHGGNLLVAHPAYPAATAPEMIAQIKRSKAPMLYGSWGLGSGGHLAMESIKLSTGADLQHVPYKGVAPLLQDLAGGQIQVAMADIAGSLPLLKAGRIKALAVTGRQRSSALPDVPTLVEGGLPFDTESWFALFAPARTPAPVVEKLTRAATTALDRPDLAERVHSLGMERDLIPREAFERQWRQDIATWARLVQASGVKAE